MPTLARDYDSVATKLQRTAPAAREQAMTAVVDALWRELHSKGVSWLGFYVDRPEEPADRRLVLGPCRDKPACSPIGLHGACGQALLSKRTLIVRDVKDLGANYVACDPRDRSEIVVPLFNPSGGCWGVFDVDSWKVGAFDATDARGLELVLLAAGLTHRT